MIRPINIQIISLKYRMPISCHLAFYDLTSESYFCALSDQCMGVGIRP